MNNPSSDALKQVREALEMVSIFIPGMREAINTPNAEHFFLDARMQNLEAAHKDIKAALTHLDALESVVRENERYRSALEWIRTESAPPVHGTMDDMPTINAIWVVSNQAILAPHGASKPSKRTG